MTGAVRDIRIGLDIGGTSIKAVRISADGVVEHRETIPVRRGIEREDQLELVSEVTRAIRGDAAAARVGIAIGGQIRTDGSMPADATNVPSLAEIPLSQLFSERLRTPCTAINDAHAAMHGEAWLGSARGRSDVLLVTLGTGIGGGILLGGKVRRGAHGHAGEIGCWSSLGDTTFEGMASPVNFERRTGRRLGDAITAGNTDADVSATLDAIGRNLAAAHLLLDLEAIVIGGSIAAIGEPLRSAVEAAVRRHCPSAFLNGLTIVTSALGPYAGAIGAVAPSVLDI